MSFDSSIASKDERTLEALIQNHPPPPHTHPDSHIPSPPEPLIALTISEEDLATGRPDSLSPQHFKDMTGASAEGGGALLLSALISLVKCLPPRQDPKGSPPPFHQSESNGPYKGGWRGETKCSRLHARCQMGCGTPQEQRQQYTPLVSTLATFNQTK